MKLATTIYCACAGRLTIATLFKIISKFGVQAEIQSVPHIVASLVANFAPLKDDFYDHVKIHRANAKPQDPMISWMGPTLGQLDQSGSEGRFTKSLSDESTTRGDGNENVHAIIPSIGSILT